MAGRLNGKVALITGAGMGMGREASTLFASEGARIVVCDINEKAAKETVALVEKAGGKAVAAVGDVAVEAEGKRMVDDGGGAAPSSSWARCRRWPASPAPRTPTPPRRAR